MCKIIIKFTVDIEDFEFISISVKSIFGFSNFSEFILIKRKVVVFTLIEVKFLMSFNFFMIFLQQGYLKVWKLKYTYSFL